MDRFLGGRLDLKKGLLGRILGKLSRGGFMGGLWGLKPGLVG